MSHVSRAVANASAGRGTAVRTCTVLSVREDGRVNLDSGGAVLLAIPCMDSYQNRASGDAVKVLIAGQQWYVLGRVGDGVATDPFKRTELGWGQGAPAGSGWKRGVPYFRETADAYEIYVDTSTTTAPAPDPQPPGGGASAAPDPVTLTPDWRGAWRGSSWAGSQAPTQGDWTGRGNYRGGWGYGTALHDAVTAHPVKKIELRLSRSGSPHGYYRRIPVHVRLHSSAGRPNNLSLGGNEWTPFSLDVGESRIWTITGTNLATITAALGGGGSMGFGIAGSGRGDYLIAGSGIGWAKVFYQ